MEGQGIFVPEFYLQFRPFYPASTFFEFEQRLHEQNFSKPFQIADIGCGTGHSAYSLLKTGIDAQITGIDPDPAMLAAAKSLFLGSPFEKQTHWKTGTAEDLPLARASLDGLLVGSAFHWMNAQRASFEFHRVLKPQGLLRLFEYQFPKALSHPELNEWIRQQFNEKWRAPGQVPRGSFKQVTQIFRESSHWLLRGERRPEMILSLSEKQLTGLILSQSRVYHYERSLPEGQRVAFRMTLSQEIARAMSSHASLDFDFKLHWVEFQKRSTE